MSSWVSKDIGALTGIDAENNANIISDYFRGKGWTVNAIAGLLANMQSESGLNPNRWENDEPYIGGYGLVQWTPYEKYSDWAGGEWESNYDLQLERIQYEVDSGLQWIATKRYPMSFKTFTQLRLSPYIMADIFLKNYERPDVIEQPMRCEQAYYWFKYLGGYYIPIWLMSKFKEKEKI